MLYRDRARFGQQLSRWFELLEPERIHIHILDDLIHDRDATLRRLLEFLEVDTEYPTDALSTHNSRHQPKSRLLRKIYRSTVPQYLRWRLLPGILGELRVRTLQTPLRGMNRQSAARVPIPPTLRERLQAELSDDLGLASQFVGRDLAALWWHDRPVPANTPVGKLAGDSTS